jgi:hypothetical protein
MNWIVNGDELGAVWKRSFYLYFVDHFRNTFHYVVAFQNRGAETHDVGDALAIARGFHYFGRETRDGFHVVQLQAAGLPATGYIRGDYDQQFFLLARS